MGRDLFASIAELHAASWGWALACCARNENDAEEALQAAYAKVLSGEARFEGKSSLRTWLFGVIRMTAKEQRRRAWVRALKSAVLGAEPPQRPSSPGIDEQVERERRARAVSAAMTRLAERQREVLHLVFYEGMTVVEAAEAMGVSAGTARIHYDRGKKRLLAELKAQGVEP